MTIDPETAFQTLIVLALMVYQPSTRLFFGSVGIAMTGVIIVVAIVGWSRESTSVLLWGLPLLPSSVALLWWGLRPPSSRLNRWARAPRPSGHS